MASRNPLNLARPINSASLSGGQRQTLGGLVNQEVVWTYPYYSRLRFTPVRSGAGPYVWTIPQGTQVTAFAYALNGDMSAAGRAGLGATLADTNLQSPGETIGGQDVYNKRIGCQLGPLSEPAFAKILWPELSVRLSLDGGQSTFNVGTPAMIPGGAGLFGQATSSLQPQAIPGGRPEVGFFTNGWPVEANEVPVPEGLIWRHKGVPDSNLAVIFRAERDVIYTGQLADEIAAAGIRGYTNPAAQTLQQNNGSVYVDIMVKLKGEVRAKRSMNV